MGDALEVEVTLKCPAGKAHHVLAILQALMSDSDTVSFDERVTALMEVAKRLLAQEQEIDEASRSLGKDNDVFWQEVKDGLNRVVRQKEERTKSENK